jgi:hypothetical protein
VPVPSSQPSSSPKPHSLHLNKRDIGDDTSIASLVLSGVVGIISTGLQANSVHLQNKGNSIASASYRLAVQGAVGGAQAVGTGITTTAGGIVDTGQAVGNSLAGGLSSAGSSTLRATSRGLSFLLRNKWSSLNPFSNRTTTASATSQVERIRPDQDVHQLEDGTFELFRNLNDGTTQRIAVYDESLFPAADELSHEELVRKAVLYDGLWEVGSTTGSESAGAEFGVEENAFRETEVLNQPIIVISPSSISIIEENPWMLEMNRG